jgi:hypothetical protein
MDRKTYVDYVSTGHENLFGELLDKRLNVLQQMNHLEIKDIKYDINSHESGTTYSALIIYTK